MHGAEYLGHQHLHPAAQHLRSRIAEHSLGLRIDHLDLTGRADHDHGARRRLDHSPEARLALGGGVVVTHQIGRSFGDALLQNVVADLQRLSRKQQPLLAVAQLSCGPVLLVDGCPQFLVERGHLRRRWQCQQPGHERPQRDGGHHREACGHHLHHGFQPVGGHP